MVPWLLINAVSNVWEKKFTPSLAREIIWNFEIILKNRKIEKWRKLVEMANGEFCHISGQSSLFLVWLRGLKYKVLSGSHHRCKQNPCPSNIWKIGSIQKFRSVRRYSEVFENLEVFGGIWKYLKKIFPENWPYRLWRNASAGTKNIAELDTAYLPGCISAGVFFRWKSWLFRNMSCHISFMGSRVLLLTIRSAVAVCFPALRF